MRRRNVYITEVRGDDPKVQAIVIAKPLVELLVQEPVCGKSDYSDLPGARAGVRTPWRSYADFPRRNSLSSSPASRRQSSVLSDEQQKRKEEARLRREKINRQREERRAKQRAQQQERRRQQEYLDQLQNENQSSEGKDKVLSNPGLIIAKSPMRGSPARSPRRDSRYSELEHTEKAKKKKIAMDLSKKFSASSSSDLNMQSSDADQTVSTTCPNESGEKEGGSHGVHESNQYLERLENIEQVIEEVVNEYSQDSSEETIDYDLFNNLDSPSRPRIEDESSSQSIPEEYRHTDDSHVTSKPRVQGKDSLLDVTSTTYLEIADADSSTSNVPRKRTRKMKRVNYHEMSDYEDSDSEAIQYSPVKMSKTSGRTIKPNDRTLEKAIVDASMAKKPRKTKVPEERTEKISQEADSVSSSVADSNCEKVKEISEKSCPGTVRVELDVSKQSTTFGVSMPYSSPIYASQNSSQLSSASYLPLAQELLPAHSGNIIPLSVVPPPLSFTQPVFSPTFLPAMAPPQSCLYQMWGQIPIRQPFPPPPSNLNWLQNPTASQAIFPTSSHLLPPPGPQLHSRLNMSSLLSPNTLPKVIAPLLQTTVNNLPSNQHSAKPLVSQVSSATSQTCSQSKPLDSGKVSQPASNLPPNFLLEPSSSVQSSSTVAVHRNSQSSSISGGSSAGNTPVNSGRQAGLGMGKTSTSSSFSQFSKELPVKKENISSVSDQQKSNFTESAMVRLDSVSKSNHSESGQELVPSEYPQHFLSPPVTLDSKHVSSKSQNSLVVSNSQTSPQATHASSSKQHSLQLGQTAVHSFLSLQGSKNPQHHYSATVQSAENSSSDKRGTAAPSSKKQSQLAVEEMLNLLAANHSTTRPVQQISDSNVQKTGKSVEKVPASNLQSGSGHTQVLSAPSRAMVFRTSQPSLSNPHPSPSQPLMPSTGAGNVHPTKSASELGPPPPLIHASELRQADLPEVSASLVLSPEVSVFSAPNVRPPPAHQNKPSVRPAGSVVPTAHQKSPSTVLNRTLRPTCQPWPVQSRQPMNSGTLRSGVPKPSNAPRHSLNVPLAHHNVSPARFMTATHSLGSQSKQQSGERNKSHISTGKFQETQQNFTNKNRMPMPTDAFTENFFKRHVQSSSIQNSGPSKNQAENSQHIPQHGRDLNAGYLNQTIGKEGPSVSSEATYAQSSNQITSVQNSRIPLFEKFNPAIGSSQTMQRPSWHMQQSVQLTYHATVTTAQAQNRPAGQTHHTNVFSSQKNQSCSVVSSLFATPAHVPSTHSQSQLTEYPRCPPAQRPENALNPRTHNPQQPSAFRAALHRPQLRPRVQTMSLPHRPALEAVQRFNLRPMIVSRTQRIAVAVTRPATSSSNQQRDVKPARSALLHALDLSHVKSHTPVAKQTTSFSTLSTSRLPRIISTLVIDKPRPSSTTTNSTSVRTAYDYPLTKAQIKQEFYPENDAESDYVNSPRRPLVRDLNIARGPVATPVPTTVRSTHTTSSMWTARTSQSTDSGVCPQTAETHNTRTVSQPVSSSTIHSFSKTSDTTPLPDHIRIKKEKHSDYEGNQMRASSSSSSLVSLPSPCMSVSASVLSQHHMVPTVVGSETQNPAKKGPISTSSTFTSSSGTLPYQPSNSNVNPSGHKRPFDSAESGGDGGPERLSNSLSGPKQTCFSGATNVGSTAANQSICTSSLVPRHIQIKQEKMSDLERTLPAPLQKISLESTLPTSPLRRSSKESTLPTPQPITSNLESTLPALPRRRPSPESTSSVKSLSILERGLKPSQDRILSVASVFTLSQQETSGQSKMPPEFVSTTKTSSTCESGEANRLLPVSNGSFPQSVTTTSSSGTLSSGDTLHTRDENPKSAGALENVSTGVVTADNISNPISLNTSLPQASLVVISTVNSVSSHSNSTSQVGNPVPSLQKQIQVKVEQTSKSHKNNHASAEFVVSNARLASNGDMPQNSEETSIAQKPVALSETVSLLRNHNVHSVHSSVSSSVAKQKLSESLSQVGRDKTASVNTGETEHSEGDVGPVASGGAGYSGVPARSVPEPTEVSKDNSNLSIPEVVPVAGAEILAKSHAETNTPIDKVSSTSRAVAQSSVDVTTVTSRLDQEPSVRLADGCSKPLQSVSYSQNSSVTGKTSASSYNGNHADITIHSENAQTKVAVVVPAPLFTTHSQPPPSKTSLYSSEDDPLFAWYTSMPTAADKLTLDDLTSSVSGSDQSKNIPDLSSDLSNQNKYTVTISMPNNDAVGSQAYHPESSPPDLSVIKTEVNDQTISVNVREVIDVSSSDEDEHDTSLANTEVSRKVQADGAETRDKTSTSSEPQKLISSDSTNIPCSFQIHVSIPSTGMSVVPESEVKSCISPANFAKQTIESRITGGTVTVSTEQVSGTQNHTERMKEGASSIITSGITEPLPESSSTSQNIHTVVAVAVDTHCSSGDSNIMSSQTSSSITAPPGKTMTETSQIAMSESRNKISKNVTADSGRINQNGEKLQSLGSAPPQKRPVVVKREYAEGGSDVGRDDEDDDASNEDAASTDSLSRPKSAHTSDLPGPGPSSSSVTYKNLPSPALSTASSSSSIGMPFKGQLSPGKARSSLSSPGHGIEQTLAAIGSWSKEEVSNWLKGHKLDQICPNLGNLDCKGLQRMAFEYHHDPDVFYTRVKKTLGLSLFQTLVICRSMKELTDCGSEES